MSKSLISAKVLGGGIAGASGVVGTGYGITRCFKSEETNVPDQSSQTTTDVVTEEQIPAALPESQPNPTEENNLAGSRSDDNSLAQENPDSPQADSSSERSVEGGNVGQQGDSQQLSSEQLKNTQEQDGKAPSTGSDGNRADIENPTSTPTVTTTGSELVTAG